MDTKVKKHLQNCRQHIEWDPSNNKFDDKVSHYDGPKLHEAMRKMAKECWSIDMTKEQVEVMPFFNFLFVAYGHAKPSDLVALMQKGKDARGRYMSVIDPVPEFIKYTDGSEPTSKAVTRQFYNLKAASPELDINGMKLKPFDEDSAHGRAVSGVLKANGMPGWNQMLDVLDEFAGTTPEIIKKAQEEKDNALTLASTLQADVDRMKNSLADLQLKADQAFTPIEVEASGEIPAGKYVLKPISELFPNIEGPRGGKTTFDKDWEIPCWEWEGKHPQVPVADPHYIFRKQELVPVLYALVTNQRAYLQGHTGSGKTTLIEQVAAVLNWPFIRINFDSEITRMDLIGRDTLKTVDGQTISEFVDGILPRAMQSASIVCFDEFDFVRPDVAYVLQAATEGNGMRITEDGDRYITPHPMFRMFATGNTVGQGDEDGMYQGARPQSIALLDRFTIWVTVDYLAEKQRRALIERHFPGLAEAEVDSICLYTNEHLNAFKEGQVTQPISPRGMLAISRATMMLGSVKDAVNMTVINRANQGDRATFNGIVNRVFK